MPILTCHREYNARLVKRQERSGKSWKSDLLMPKRLRIYIFLIRYTGRKIKLTIGIW